MFLLFEHSLFHIHEFNNIEKEQKKSSCKFLISQQ